MAKRGKTKKTTSKKETIPKDTKVVYFPIYTSSGISPQAYAFQPVDYGGSYGVNFPGYPPVEEKKEEKPSVLKQAVQGWNQQLQYNAASSGAVAANIATGFGIQMAANALIASARGARNMLRRP